MPNVKVRVMGRRLVRLYDDQFRTWPHLGLHDARLKQPKASHTVGVNIPRGLNHDFSEDPHLPQSFDPDLAGSLQAHDGTT